MATAKSNSIDSTHPVTDKLQNSLHSSVDTLAEKAALAEDKVRTSASESADTINARKRLAKQKWYASGVRKYATDNPVAAAGIAFAAGMLVTSLLKKGK